MSKSELILQFPMPGFPTQNLLQVQLQQSICSIWLVLAFSRLDKNSCSLVTDVDIGEFIEVEEDTFVEQADNPMIVATEIAMKLLFI